jgi:uncharacterized protein YndB with AHSA1/START domain
MKTLQLLMALGIVLGTTFAAYAGGEKVSKKNAPTKIGNLVPASLTDAPLRIVIQKEMDASPEQLWAYLGDSRQLPKFMKQVKKVDLDARQAASSETEEGATRVCSFGKVPLTEKIVAVVPNELFAYQSQDNEMVSNHLGVIRITPTATGSTLTWYQYFDKGSNGMKASMMKMMMPGMLKKAVRRLDKIASN